MDNPPASIVTPLALRAPEVILGDSLGPAIDVWNFGCIMFELLTDYTVFELFTFGRQRTIIDDEHLIQLSEVVGPLPEHMCAHWPRYSTYFGPGGERLAAQPFDLDESHIARTIRAAPGPRDPPKPCALLEDKFYQYRPDDIDDTEAKQIASLLRGILQIDPRMRPSVAELLEHPWFQVSSRSDTRG